MTRVKATAACLIAGSFLFAQPAIEVASIKPSDPGTTAMGNHFSANQYSLTGYAAKSLIESAFDVREYQILNAPEWTRSERWTLEVKTTAPTSMRQKLQLLEPLLVERFGLRFHRQTRELPVYSLVIAKGGPKLKAAEDNADGRFSYGNDGNQVVGKKYDIRMLASYLSGGVLNLPVIDKTGLTGFYDINLKWTPDPNRPDFGDVHNPADLPAPDPNRPEIFTAIRQQLGLELKSEKGPVEVIVIDHIERPTPN